jgi:hypothetical protein
MHLLPEGMQALLGIAPRGCDALSGILPPK